MAVSVAARECLGLPEPTEADLRSLFGAPDEKAAEAGGDAPATAARGAARRRVSKHKKSGGAGTAARGSGTA